MHDDIAYDLEIFPQYFCIIFVNDNWRRLWRHKDIPLIIDFIDRAKPTLIGYNNFGYDDLILKTIYRNPQITTQQLYELSKRIISSQRMPDDLFKLQYADVPWHRSIDMYQILNKKGGLKEFECREHMKCVIESPVDFDAPLPANKVDETERYMTNDGEATWELFKKNKDAIALRAKLIDMYDLGDRPYVLGDAGIAQAIAIKKYSERTGGWSTTARKGAAECPDNKMRRWNAGELVSRRVQYHTPEFESLFRRFKSTDLIGDGPGATWDFRNKAFKEPVSLGANDYQIGVGGLHSIDGPGRWISTAEVGIYDLDVASYYPSLMIVEGVYPKHIGKGFIDEFRKVRDMRIAAKKAGDKIVDSALKIILNSSFGLFNNVYAPIRSIPSALRVTLNGQLQLLMLVEALETMGARILSANTDGVTIVWHRDRLDQLDVVKNYWQTQTGHTLEQVEYNRYCRRDVNNYCALKVNGDIKTKGAFEQKPLGGKTDERIVKAAAADYLLKDIPIRQTVEASNDIRDFIYYQRTKAGKGISVGTPTIRIGYTEAEIAAMNHKRVSLGEKPFGQRKLTNLRTASIEEYPDRVNIGKTARWYVAKAGKTVFRACTDGTFDTLPNGRNAVLALTLPDHFPVDLDREYYISEAKALVEAVTNPPKPKVKKETHDA